MFGVREAGVLGASVALAGGVAYLIWTWASFSWEKKREPGPGEDEIREGERETEEEEEREETKAEPGVVAKAQQVSEVKFNRLCETVAACQIKRHLPP